MKKTFSKWNGIKVGMSAFVLLTQTGFGQQITGNGATTQNYLPLLTGATTPSLIVGNSQIAQNGNNVGIGFTTLSNIGQPLHVNGRARFDLSTNANDVGRLYLNRASTTSQEALLLYTSGGTTTYDWALGTYNSATANNDWTLNGWTPGRVLTIPQATGNVGIGHATTTGTTPIAKLSVNGDLLVSTTGTSGAAYIQHLSGAGYSTSTTPEYTWYGNTNTGMFRPSPGNIIGFSAAGAEGLRIGNGTNPYVGVANTNPQYPLDVTGVIHSNTLFQSGTAPNYMLMGYDGANSVIYSNGTPLLLNYNNGKDVAICTGATSGYVVNGNNVEIGGVTRDANSALNIRTNGSITTALNLRNSANTSIFNVSNTGATTLSGNVNMTGSGIIQCGGSPVTTTGDLGLYSLRSGYYMRFVTNGGAFNFYADGGVHPEGSASLLSIATNGTVSAKGGSLNTSVTMGSANGSTLGYGTSYVGLNAQRDPATGNWTRYSDGANSGGGIMSGDVAGNINFSPMPTVSGAGNTYFTDADVMANQTLKIRWNANNPAAYKGQVVIGNQLPGNMTYNTALLSVSGTMVAKEIWVLDQATAGWADYVFKKDYKLMPLTEVEKYINQNQHLPNVPSAKEVETKGQNLGDLQVKQMEKIEELTLYMIELSKKVDALQKENAELKKSK